MPEIDPARRPSRVRLVYIALIPALIASFLLSGVNKQDDHHGVYWAGIFWVTFGILFVITVLFSIFVLVRMLVSRRRSAVRR